MAFFNVRINQTKRLFYTLEAANAAEAVMKATDLAKKGEGSKYNEQFQGQAVQVDPDAI